MMAAIFFLPRAEFDLLTPTGRFMFVINYLRLTFLGQYRLNVDIIKRKETSVIIL